ncbi:hypothetical protein T03_10301 [Trichinella britovi]|uniref:Uncharacterized protein n=1 Tax=Trichinella britovi TaxID=45882 RepID=A0A0V1CFZ3_TRIBR|nr:hypothetical protein T03_10301 [Trichinella britovi]
MLSDRPFQKEGKKYLKKPYKIVQILGPKTYQLRGNPEAQAPSTSESGPSGTGQAFSICHNCRMVVPSRQRVQKSGGHLSHDAPCTLLGLHPLRKSLERTRRGQYDDEGIIVPAYQMDSFVKKVVTRIRPSAEEWIRSMPKVLEITPSSSYT